MKYSMLTRLIGLAATLVLGSGCLVAMKYKKHESLETMLRNDDVPSFSICYPTKEKIVSTKGDESLLIMAIENRATKIANYLIKKGVPLSPARQDCLSPLVVASYKGLNGIVKALMTNGVNPNDDGFLGVWRTEDSVFPSGKIVVSPLMAASMKGNTETVTILLKAGAKVNVVNKIGKTPLHYAVIRRSNSMVVDLLNSGAKVDAFDMARRSPLDDALYYGNVEITKTLLERGAKPTLIRKGTISYLARNCCREGFVEKIKLLLSFGARSEEIEAWCLSRSDHQFCPGCSKLEELCRTRGNKGHSGAVENSLTQY